MHYFAATVLLVCGNAMLLAAKEQVEGGAPGRLRPEAAAAGQQSLSRTCNCTCNCVSFAELWG